MGKGRSQPRRIVTRLLVFLLLGAIVNVAVAWGCSISYNLWDVSFGRKLKESSALVETPGVGWVYARRVEGAVGLLIMRRWSKPDANAPFSIDPSGDIDKLMVGWPEFERPSQDFLNSSSIYSDLQSLEARGWPTLTLYWTESKTNEGASHSFGIPLPMQMWQDPSGNRMANRYLPLRPIWPGFAINTIFYAAILWLLWTARLAPGAVRRMRRKQRGLCIHCAYDLRGAAPDSANCPECGKPRARLEP